MKHRSANACSLGVAMALLFATGAEIRAQVLEELDAFWAEVSRTVEAGDFEGYSATYHPDAVVIFGLTSQPIAAALAGWEEGFADTRSGRTASSVAFRFSERRNDGTTAHETGIFRFEARSPSGEGSAQYIHFEALLVKRDGWKMSMEYQQEPATAEEWNALGAGQTSRQSTYILVAGRRLPYLYAISLDAALDPVNDRTSNAIVGRSKVALDRLDGRPLGDPANLVVSEDGGTVYVVNHHGAIDNAEFNQHGGRGQIAVLDVDAVLDPENDRTAKALVRHMDSGGFGALGVVLLPDMLVLGGAENHLTEDGGNRITFVDRKTGSLRHTVELALGSPGFECQDYPVPYVAPRGPPRNLAVLSPDPSWGCFPDPNGLALGRASDGRRYLFSANGGTGDVSVIDLDRALEGDRLAEVARVPTQVGPWGIAATPDGRRVIVANGGSQRERRSGNTLSFIDVDRASTGAADAEVARVLVGTDDPEEESHPLIPSVTPDARHVVVPNIRTNNVSIVDLDRAFAGDPEAEVARIPLVRDDGRIARPKGSAITSDGRYAIISAGPRSEPLSEEPGHVYVIDLSSQRVVATVTGVGNDPYGVALVYR